jgi:hypothetical protein
MPDVISKPRHTDRFYAALINVRGHPILTPPYSFFARCQPNSNGTGRYPTYGFRYCCYTQDGRISPMVYGCLAEDYEKVSFSSRRWTDPYDLVNQG